MSKRIKSQFKWKLIKLFTGSGSPKRYSLLALESSTESAEIRLWANVIEILTFEFMV